MKSLKYELQVMFHKKEFSLALCIMMIVSIYSFILVGFDNFNFGALSTNVISADMNFMMNDYTNGHIIHLFLFPFVIVLPHAMSYINDKESGAINLIITRNSKKNYFLTKMIACFIGNFLVFLIPLFINLILCHLTFPDLPNYYFGFHGDRSLVNELFLNNLAGNFSQKSIPFLKIFLLSPTLYNVLYIFIISIASGILGMFLMCFSFVFDKHRAIVFLPVYLFIIVAKFVTMLIEKQFNVYINFDICDYFSIMGFGGLSLIYVVSLILFIFIFCVFSFKRVLKKEISL